MKSKTAAHVGIPLFTFFTTFSPLVWCAWWNDPLNFHPLRWKTTWSSWGRGAGARWPSWKSVQSTRWALASRKKDNWGGFSSAKSPETKLSYQAPARCICGKSLLKAFRNAHSSWRRESSISQTWTGHPGALAMSKAALAVGSRDAGHTTRGSWQSSLLAMVDFTRQKISLSSPPEPIARGIRPRMLWICSGIPAWRSTSIGYSDETCNLEHWTFANSNETLVG